MLYITATNFGVNPNFLNIRAYYEDNLLVLDGNISVDTTAEAYAGIQPMTLSVGDLPFAKSRVSTALVTAASEGVNYCTLAKVWVSDKNTILIPTIITGPVSLNEKISYEVQFNKGTGDGVEVIMVKNPNWLMFVMKASNLEFDAEDQTIEMRLPDFPSDISINPPIIYNESRWSNLGSKYYPAYLRNGVLTISKADAADEPEGTGSKFTRIIAVR